MTLYLQNLVIHSSGRLETSDFRSDARSWRISSEGNGTYEFENIKVRGTLQLQYLKRKLLISLVVSYTSKFNRLYNLVLGVVHTYRQVTRQ